MEVYKVKIRGIKPLLMHNPVGNISNVPTRRRSEIPDPEKEAESYLYKDPEGNICIPAYMIKACIRSAGRNYRVKQRYSTYASMIRAGIDIEPEYIPLKHNGWMVDVRPVVVKGNRILRARPRFDEWELEFKLINKDPAILKFDIIKKILEDAGKYYGLGDYRPEFGLFEVIEIVKVK